MNQVVAPINFTALLDMLGGDRQIVTALLSAFIEEVAADIAASQQAIADGDAEALRLLAHRIKGTSANLHAVMLSASARELEQACAEADTPVMTIKHQVLLDQAQRLREAIEAWLASG